MTRHVGKVCSRTWSRRGPTGRKVSVVSWGFTVQVDGKQVKRFDAEWTRDTARDELAKFVLSAGKTKATPVTFGEAVERYAVAKADKATLSEDRRILKLLLAHFGEDTKLDRITRAAIVQYRDQRFAAGSRKCNDADGQPRRLTPAAVNRELAVLRHLLRLAHEEWGALADVPKLEWKKKEPQGRLRWLTPEEANTMLSKCREQKPDLADLVEFCLLTGLRRGEALGLTWDRVDRARSVIRLEVTKSGRRREVPLDEADRVLQRRGVQATGFVFGTPSWWSFRAYWEEAVQAANLVDFHFHDLRHTFASWAMQHGATLPELKDLLGHSSLAMVMRYAHLAPGHLRSAVSRLNGILAPLPADANGASNGEAAAEAAPFSPQSDHSNEDDRPGVPQVPDILTERSAVLR